MKLIEYFDRVCIVHLPEAVDRFRALERELRLLDVDIHDPKIRVPFAPRPEDANGYPSRGYYGGFLSHYGILKEAMQDGIETVWILEDDAIFSRRMAREQARIVDALRRTPWDFCFFGHSLSHELAGLEKGLVHSSAPFIWAHCYAVHARVLPRLLDYLERTMSNPPGHPEGGRVGVEAAYNLFRKFNPDIVSLMANPVLSLQKGGISSLAGSHWYDRNRAAIPFVSMARAARDELWRRTGLHVSNAIRQRTDKK